MEHFPVSQTTTPPPYHPGLAALLSLLAPGLGQFYLGQTFLAIILHLGWLCLLAALVFWAPASFNTLLRVAALLLVWGALSALHAARLGRRRPNATGTRRVGSWPSLLGLALLVNGATEFTLLRLCPSRYALLEMCAASMGPTLLPGESIVADLAAFRHRLPDRQELVVIASPEDAQALWVLRCVGLPGDMVEVRDREILLNGTPLPGLNPGFHAMGRPEDSRQFEQAGPVLLQEGQLYCLGDNLDNALDSRCFGPIPASTLRGKPLYRLLSDQASRRGGALP